ncbi:hypothetical protein M2451_002877 [Dysgonomonas sp. PFB1-18]|uniref:hypothetical protein n=1 Tax=unclassified Dysgonomonas TaxID=2630389 RepID=UPI002475EC52|nr:MULTISPECIES: hypothetical protein [unclassified Dysgonomonas]MDH6309987.1 hypothetical protein [Dysgonomonas sp. PF1-14]MDH6339896.1 hypothetical protein [Dysgonomonas sp. PF1-16]MDH6381544.1 hypothetical protein [Dysgonomonas sp. PFB1-18]MDH6398819.1 hypothetical protein [Dysgonomonas sp. PF1-23]
MESLFTEGFLLSFSSYIDSIGNKKEAVNLPPKIALPRTVRMLIADRLLSSRARFLLTS